MADIELFNTRKLAEHVGVSQQYINKLYKNKDTRILSPIYKIGVSPVWNRVQADSIKKQLKGE